MGFDKPRSNGMGAEVSRRSDRGMNESLHGKKVQGDVDHKNHVHFHGNTATVTKNGEKYSMLDVYCSNCDLTRKHKRTINKNTGDNMYTCTHCGKKS
jgi:hypothetical protein